MKYHRIKALLLNYYYFTINSMDRVFDLIYWPVLEILIWGFMAYFIQGISSVNLMSMIFGGIILWLFLWRASQDIAIYLLESYWARSIYYFFVSPLTTSELISGLCILAVIRAGASFVILSLLSYFVYSVNILSFNPFYLVYFIVLLIMLGWGIGLMISSLIFRFGSKIQVLAWSVIWVVQPFSCVFYPLSALPPWAEKIAIVLPTTHIFEAM